MRRQILGFVAGLLLGAATSAFAARLIGDGYLTGWDVVTSDGLVCSDPYVWSGTHEIECD